MTNLRKAAEMALKALENMAEYSPSRLERQIDALRQALAQPEQTMHQYKYESYGLCERCKTISREGHKCIQKLNPIYTWDEVKEQMNSKQSDHGFDRTASHMAGEYVDTAQPKQEPVAWTRVSDGLPKSGVIVLACYLTRLGNLRRIRAHWIAAKTEETGVDNDFFEYDEETDAYYLPEGWYECIDNWDDYTSVFVCEGEVTHWMPLPPAPDEKYTAPPTTPDSAKHSADSAESFCKQELHNLMSVAGRMALELECLLLDTENLSVVSKWWDTGMEALQAYRHYVWSVTHGKDGENFCDTHCVHTDHHPDCELAQPEQEPVVWWNGGNTEDESEDFMYPKTRQAHIDHPDSFTHTFYPIPLYTAPPKREWVGLTDEERAEFDKWVLNGMVGVAHAIEAKLKEKNT